MVFEEFMKVTNIGGFNSINEYIEDKIRKYGQEEKNFRTLFHYMFSEKENIMVEETDGYRIKKTTYGQCAEEICKAAGAFDAVLSPYPKGAKIGLYMSNSKQWIQAFWAMLMCGYNPVFLNARVSDDVLEQVLRDYDIPAVITEGKTFSVDSLNVSGIFDRAGEELFHSEQWGEEIFFMSSGTTGMVKLCAYTGENFYYQIRDSINIVKRCPQMKAHYEGELKNLALLPFYHVFGFIAVYVWFTFFSRTLVFPRDLNPQTIQNTIKKHKVTHIFAVPLVWETVYKKTLATVRNQGEKTWKKFNSAMALADKAGAAGKLISRVAFKEVREKLFGESIMCMISGGSAISEDALRFYNGIGYHMANGFGMTEVGITSVEISKSAKVRNSGSIGSSFECTQYSVSEKGELLVKGRTMASRVLHNSEERVTDFDQWFNTNDLVEYRNGRYYHQGRKDDLIVCDNGENLNPELLEKNLYTEGVRNLCLFPDEKGRPILLASIENCFSERKLTDIYESIRGKVRENNLQDEIKEILLTTDDLMEAGEIKVSRKKIGDKYRRGVFRLIDTKDFSGFVNTVLSTLEQEVCKCFADALQKDESEIGVRADFFTDLGGSSLDYFVLLDLIGNRFNTETTLARDKKLATAADFAEYIRSIR